MLTEVDEFGLVMFASEWERWVRYETMIRSREIGEIHKTKDGNVATNPMLWVANKSWDHLYKMLSEYGFTPAQRSRIKVGSKQTHFVI